MHLGCTPTSCVSYVKLRKLCVLSVLCELLFAALTPQKWSRVTLWFWAKRGDAKQKPTNLGRGRIPPLGIGKIKNIIIRGQSYIGPQTFLGIIPPRIANV